MLSAEDRDAIAQLQLFARDVVEGVTGGRHRSPHKGSSVEFKEHRQYARGDSIRSIDWKLFGKTDRLFIRQYEDETNLRAMVLVDQSGSMAYRGSRSEFSKHQFAIRLAACIATLLFQQQDSVGLATIDTQVQRVVPPRSMPSHLQVIFETLVQASPGGETSLAAALQQSTRQLRRRGALFVISDCFDEVGSFVSALRYFRRSGSQVVVFQIWDPDELDFPFRSRTQFRSLEKSGSQRMIDPVALRASYLARVDDFNQRLEQALSRERIALVRCVTNDRYSDILTRFLAQN